MIRPGRLLLAASLALTPAVVRAVTLDDAIALAVKHDPGLRRAAAEQDAAHARLDQARAGRLPTVTLSGSVAEAPTNYHQFFGFPRQTLTPASAQIELRQPIFTGGAVDAAIGQAKAGEGAAKSAREGARLGLAVDVAQSFEAVLVSERALELQRRQAADLTLVVEQAERRFHDGEAPSTDVNEAKARRAAAEADLARAEGRLAVARARYADLVGEEPVGLEPPAAAPLAPEDINVAVAQAAAGNPSLAAAQDALAAADQGVRRARAEGAPTVALVANASSLRDEFLPGYRADAVSIGVQGRWAIFSGGLVAAKVGEAAARRRAAEAGLDQARQQVREAAIEAWYGLSTARSVAAAADAQSTAADAALADVREEVRVGEKPILDLLNAERESLAAHIAVLAAEADAVVAAYRLRAVIGGG